MGWFSSDIEKTITHGLTPTEVISRLETGLESKLQRAFPDGDVDNLQLTWSGTNGSFTCTAGGHDLSGVVQVSQSSLFFKVELPAFAGLEIDTDDLKNKVSREIQDLLK